MSTSLRPILTPPTAASAEISSDEPWLSAFVVGLAGWTLDAFDFFLVVLSLTAIGQEFGQDLKHMAMALTATLAFRPVGALLSGSIADRFGRRTPAIVNLCLFAVIELATGVAHSFRLYTMSISGKGKEFS